MLKQFDDASVFRLDPNEIEVDAAGSFSIDATITCTDQRDLAGSQFILCDHDGQEVGRAACSRGADGSNGLRIENVAALLTPGHFKYTLRLAQADNRTDMEAATLAVNVRPHLSRVTVWDVPPALRPGERFTFLAGVKCSLPCSLEGHAVQVTDEAGTRVVVERLGSDIWPGTDGLHVARVHATAPEAVGSHAWSVASSSALGDVAHESASCDLRVTVVESLDCAVEVRVVELATGRALSRANVVLHPFRAVTDEDGSARLRVSKGEYDLLVSCSRHLPSATPCSITTDKRIQIALELEDLWTPVDEA